MSQNLIEAYYSHCLKTNLPAALRVLRRKAQDHRTLRFKSRVHRRFVVRTEKQIIKASDPLVRAVIFCYREYYRKALLNVAANARFERELEDEVRAAAMEQGIKQIKNLNWKSVERILAKEFRRRGYFALFVRVTPFRSLLVWRKNEFRTYKVSLIESTQSVRVTFLDDFVELGWLHFATFGKWFVGGWAKKEGLYCVAPAYKHKFDGETFKVSYLTHEAQHFADYKRFPVLEQADLEYRAKLAELAASARPGRLLKKFRAEARDDRKLPHCFAAYKILQHLNEMKCLSRIKLNAAAAKMIQGHSRKLLKFGAKRVKTAL